MSCSFSTDGGGVGVFRVWTFVLVLEQISVPAGFGCFSAEQQNTERVLGATNERANTTEEDVESKEEARF